MVFGTVVVIVAGIVVVNVGNGVKEVKDVVAVVVVNVVVVGLVSVVLVVGNVDVGFVEVEGKVVV